MQCATGWPDGAPSFREVAKALSHCPKENSLTDDAWQELIRFDPDTIHSFAPIPDKLLDQLHTRLSPWHIKEPQPRHDAGELKNQTNAPVQNPLQWIVEGIQFAGVPVPPTEQRS